MVPKRISLPVETFNLKATNVLTPFEPLSMAVLHLKKYFLIQVNILFFIFLKGSLDLIRLTYIIIIHKITEVTQINGQCLNNVVIRR